MTTLVYVDATRKASMILVLGRLVEAENLDGRLPERHQSKFSAQVSLAETTIVYQNVHNLYCLLQLFCCIFLMIFSDSFWCASCVKYAQILLWTHYFINCAS